MLEHHQQRKAQVTAVLRDLAGVAGAIGMESVRTDIEAVRLPKLAEERFNLVVLGEFNHGKSTFVNALIGQPLLPAGITPTTATINHLVWAEQPHARVVRRDGTTEQIDHRQLADYVTLEGEHSREIRYVELGYPAALLEERLTLVDTPGVNDINQARAEITYSYIPRADAVIFLLDSTQVLKQSERAFIQQRLLRRSRDKLLFVLGKIDLLDEEERAQTMAFAREHLAALVDAPEVFAVSARSHLEGDHESSGMLPLLAYLQRHLELERGRILLDNALADAQRTSHYLRSSIGLKRGTLQLSLEDLSKRVSDVRDQLAGSQSSLLEMNERIRNEAEAVKATIRHDLRQFIERFCDELPHQIDRVDAVDVKAYLQFFIQDKFKEWTEREGDKVAELLENLAEEMIQVANENVRTVLDATAGGLGADETRVQLDVDTLKYDAGLFALGALGTTVFLFVNTFVGGLLTLAAPLLAVVLRERAGARIKAQAKKHAPEAIRRAGEAISPRFEEVVDAFADRLSEFIASAGNTLYRGISEVLDRALAERDREQADSAVADDELATQETALDAIDERLDRLRETLWEQGLVDGPAERLPGPQEGIDEPAEPSSGDQPA